MTFEETLKELNEIVSPYFELRFKEGYYSGEYNSYTLMVVCSPTEMSVHYVNYDENGRPIDWTYDRCHTIAEVKKSLPKMIDTFMELKYPNYHKKLEGIKHDF
jgi:hypothetical protein